MKVMLCGVKEKVEYCFYFVVFGVIITTIIKPNKGMHRHLLARRLTYTYVKSSSLQCLYLFGHWSTLQLA